MWHRMLNVPASFLDGTITESSFLYILWYFDLKSSSIIMSPLEIILTHEWIDMIWRGKFLETLTWWEKSSWFLSCSKPFLRRRSAPPRTPVQFQAIQAIQVSNDIQERGDEKIRESPERLRNIYYKKKTMQQISKIETLFVPNLAHLSLAQDQGACES